MSPQQKPTILIIDDEEPIRSLLETVLGGKYECTGVCSAEAALSVLKGNVFELELTETTIMENAEAAVELLNRIRKLGVKIAMDDFGTGYSSLSYLKRLPIDTLKLDRSFVDGSTSDPNDAALVVAVITLAHSFRLQVIAEGVETEEHLRFLRLLGCDGGQGYLFGKPMPADVFRASLDRELDHANELLFSATSAGRGD